MQFHQTSLAESLAGVQALCLAFSSDRILEVGGEIAESITEDGLLPSLTERQRIVGWARLTQARARAVNVEVDRSFPPLS